MRGEAVYIPEEHLHGRHPVIMRLPPILEEEHHRLQEQVLTIKVLISHVIQVIR